MPEVVLAPITQNDSLSRGVEQELVAYLEETIFGPLLDLLETHNIDTRENAKISALVAAVQARQVWYIDGVFTGQFNAAISRELRALGATRPQGSHTFKLPISKMPFDLRSAVSASSDRSKKVSQQVLDTLKQIQENIVKAPTGIKLDQKLEGILGDLEKQFKRTASSANVRVAPDLTQHVKETINSEYTQNLDLYIKDFATKRIPELRKRVEENIFAGGRTDRLAKIIQAEYGVGKRKAAFLAEQETSLLVSKYREARYRETGSRRYIWSTSQDVRVRDDHKDLNNKVFFWDQPPITNKATGAHNNPGEDYGCRCIARAILPLQEDED